MPSPPSPRSARPPPSTISAGWVGFGDDGIVSEGMNDVAGRSYFSSRIAIGPELLLLGGENHRINGVVGVRLGR
jgi:hypothetical protein